MRCASRARVAGLLLMVAVVAAPLAGCGRRGQLEPAPDPSVAAVKDDTLQPIGRRAKREPIKAPQASFVLDPLL